MACALEVRSVRAGGFAATVFGFIARIWVHRDCNHALWTTSGLDSSLSYCQYIVGEDGDVQTE